MATTKQVTYRTTDSTLIATLPDGRKVEIGTELTFDELMKVGAIAVALEAGGLDEMQLFGMLSDGTLIPPSVREKSCTPIRSFGVGLVEKLSPISVKSKLPLLERAR